MSNWETVTLDLDLRKIRPRVEHLLDSFIRGRAGSLGRLNKAFDESRLLFVIIDDISRWLDRWSPATIAFDQIGGVIYVKKGYESKSYYSVEAIPTSVKSEYLSEVVDTLKNLPDGLPIQISSDGRDMVAKVGHLPEQRYRVSEAPWSVREIYRQARDMQRWRRPSEEAADGERPWVEFRPDDGAVSLRGQEFVNERHLGEDDFKTVRMAFVKLSTGERLACLESPVFRRNWKRTASVRCPNCTAWIVPKPGILWGWYCPVCDHMLHV